MRHEDDEINPFSREATAKRANRDDAAQSEPAEPPPPRPRKRSSLVWLIPVLLMLVVGPLLCCGGLLLFGFNKMNEPVDAAIVALEVDKQISAKLGSPITRTGGFAVKDYRVENGNGSAFVEFEVSGPNGSANVTGKMKLFAGVWNAEDLTVTCSDGIEFRLPRAAAGEAADSL